MHRRKPYLFIQWPWTATFISTRNLAVVSSVNCRPLGHNPCLYQYHGTGKTWANFRRPLAILASIIVGSRLLSICDGSIYSFKLYSARWAHYKAGDFLPGLVEHIWKEIKHTADLVCDRFHRSAAWRIFSPRRGYLRQPAQIEVARYVSLVSEKCELYEVELSGETRSRIW